MSAAAHHLCEILLDRQRSWVIWYAGDIDALMVDDRQRLLRFGDVQAAAACVAARGLGVMFQEVVHPFRV